MYTIGPLLLCFLMGSFQDNNATTDVVDWLPNDTAIVVAVNELDLIANVIKKTDWFESNEFELLQEVLCHEQFGLIRSDDYQSIRSDIEKLVEHRSHIDSVHFVVNPSGSIMPQVTCIFTLKRESNDQVSSELQVQMSSLLEKLEKAIRSDNLSSSHDDERNASDHPVDRKQTPIEKIAHRAVSNFLILSNDAAYCQALAERVKPTADQRGLSSLRAYQRVTSIRGSSKNDKGAVTFYLNPEASKSMIALFDESDWGMYQINEFRALHGSLYFDEQDDNIDGVIPPIHGVATIIHTLPPPNYVQILESYNRIEEVPRFAFPIVEVSIVSRDAKKHHETSKRIYDATHGVGTYDEKVQLPYANDVRDYFEDVLPRTNDWFNFRYQGRHGRSYLMSMQKINDRPAMERYVDGLVEMTNTLRHGDRFSRFEEEGILYWALSEKALELHLQKTQKLASRFADLQLDRPNKINWETVPSDGYAITPDRYLLGDMHDVRSQLKFEQNGDGLDHAEIINGRLKWLTNRHGITHPIKLDVTSPEIKLLQYAERPVVEYIRKKYITDPRKRNELIRKFYESRSLPFSIECRQDTEVSLGYCVSKVILKSFGQQMVVFGKGDALLEFGFGLFPER